MRPPIPGFALAAVAAVLASAAGGQPGSRPGAPPETSIPPSFVEVAGFLFDHGMADPRGGEFRNVTVIVGESVFGFAWPVDTAGWVFRGPDGKPERVVCWNGLAYWPAHVGGPADLPGFVEKGIAHQMAGTVPGQEEYAAASSPTGLVAAALLLRVGRADLGEKVYRSAREPAFVADENTPGRLLRAYVYCRYCRAIVAHMRGDSPTSASDAEILLRNAKGLEAAADRWPGYPGAAGPVVPADTTALAADSERRRAHPRSGPLDLAAIAKLPVPERTARLVELLDEVRPQHWSVPNGTVLAAHPIVRALIEVGDAAVDALIACSEHDTRLTRFVANLGALEFGPRRPLVSVREAACTAIEAIVRAGPLPQTPDGKVDVPALRAYWQHMRRLTPAERLYSILADDKARPVEWLAAAALVATRSDVPAGLEWMGPPRLEPGKAPPPLLGEPLRHGKQPSVDALMAERARQMMSGAARTGDAEEACRAAADAVRVAVALARWDTNGNRAVLRDLDRSAADAVVAGKAQGFWRMMLQTALAALATVRLRAGDHEAVDDYARWLATADGPGSGGTAIARLWPLCDSPVATEELARHLFSGPPSQWDPRTGLREKPFLSCMWAADVARSQLVRQAPVRECIIAMMQDATVVGNVSFAGAFGTFSSVDYNMLGGGGGGYSLPAGHETDDPAMPPKGTRCPYRVCDVVAAALQDYTGAPAYRPYWSDPARNAAIARLVAFVKEAGAGLADRYRGEAGWARIPPPGIE